MGGFEVKEIKLEDKKISSISFLLDKKIGIKVSDEYFTGVLKNYFFFNNSCYLLIETLCNSIYIIRLEKVTYIKIID